VSFIDRVPSALPVLVQPPTRVAMQTMEATAFFMFYLRVSAEKWTQEYYGGEHGGFEPERACNVRGSAESA
jgi:hypothetical protein